MSCMAVGISSCERRLSDRMQDGTKRKDSHIDTHCPFSGRRTLPEWRFTSLSTQDLHMDSNAMGIRRRARDIHQHTRAQANENRGREEKTQTGRGSQGPLIRKIDRLSKRHLRTCRTEQVSKDEVLSWKRWSIVLMWYACKKQGHAHIGN